jgi:hypothetical protein
LELPDDLDEKSFAYRDLLALDRWDSFSVSTNAVFVGTQTVVGRYRLVGKMCQFQASLAATTSFATTSGTHYLALPIPAKGLAGMATLTNTSTNVTAGTCAVNVSTSRVYFPSVTPSAATFTVAGWYEVA